MPHLFIDRSLSISAYLEKKSKCIHKCSLFCSTPEHEKYTYGNSATFLYRISDIWQWFKKSCLWNIGHLLLYHNFKQNEQAVDVSFHYSSSFSRISLSPAAPGIWIRIWYCVRSLYHDEKNRHDFKLQSSMKLKFV